MIALYVLLVLVCALAIQHRYAERCLERLVYESDLDRELAEPDQVLTLTSTVRNPARLPILCVNLMEPLPEQVRPEEDEAWCRRHLRRPVFGQSCSEQLWLPGRRRYTKQFHFSLPDRGSYVLGKYYLTAGDYLGLHTRYEQGTRRRKVVVMPRRWEDPQLALTLGGYLGEISVRRFLFEDPVLTIGVREYTGSEPLKQISWKQTARTGTLQVKNYDYTVDANVTVLLNLEGGSDADRELSFQMARTVCETLERRRIPYEFFGNGDLFGPQGELKWFPEGLGSQHYRTLMYALGQCKGTVYFSFPRMVERCVQRRRRSRGYVVISPPLRERDREALRALRRISETEPCLLTARAEEGGETA